MLLPVCKYSLLTFVVPTGFETLVKSAGRHSNSQYKDASIQHIKLI